MRSFSRMLRQARASLRTMVWRVIEIAGKVVMTLVPGPSTAASPVESAEDLAGVPDMAPARSSGGRYEHIRALARQIDFAPADAIMAVGAPTASWLAAMPKVMIAKVLLATDEQIAEHMAGRRTIRGLLAYDPDTIKDYVRVTSRPAESRTLDLDRDDEAGLALAF